MWKGLRESLELYEDKKRGAKSEEKFGGIGWNFSGKPRYVLVTRARSIPNQTPCEHLIDLVFKKCFCSDGLERR